MGVFGQGKIYLCLTTQNTKMTAQFEIKTLRRIKPIPEPTGAF